MNDSPDPTVTDFSFHVSLHFLMSIVRFALVLMCVIAVCFVVIVPIQIGPSMRYSAYYVQRDLEAVLKEERQRRTDADEWVARVAASESPWTVAESVKKKKFLHGGLCIALLTAPRDGEPSKYVSHTLRSMFEHLSDEEGRKIVLVAIVRGKEAAPEIFEKFHRVVRKNASRGTISDEYDDYISAVDACAEFPRTLNALVLQDDLSACQGFVDASLRVARDAEVRSQGRWKFVKLFYHQFWDGWAVETTPYLVVFCVILCISVFVACFFLFFRRQKLFDRLFFSLLLAITACFCCVYFSVVMGRQNVLHTSITGLSPNRGSAAVAILYRGGLLQDLSKYLRQHVARNPLPIDLQIDEWASKQDEAYLYSPSLFQHMGLSSSIAHKAGSSMFRLMGMKEDMYWQNICPK